MKPFLILQLRPVKQAADGEYEAFLHHGGLKEEDTVRVDLFTQDIPEIDFNNYSGIIVGGGAPCVSDKEKKDEVIRFEAQLKTLVEKVVEEDFPYLGACYGLGFLADVTGGVVCKDKDASEDVGAVDVLLTEDAKEDDLVKELPQTFRAFVGHKESCVQAPKNAVVLARSERCPVHLLRIGKNVYATQFHPELDVEGICVRIDVYKNAGYFPPEDAEPLKESARQEKITVPAIFLRNWINKYKK